MDPSKLSFLIAGSVVEGVPVTRPPDEPTRRRWGTEADQARAASLLGLGIDALLLEDVTIFTGAGRCRFEFLVLKRTWLERLG